MRIRRAMLFTVVLAVTALLSACSGGGSGGGGSSALSYTGVTTAAVITNSNAKTLALESFSTGTSAGSTQNTAKTVAVVDTTYTAPDIGVIVSRLITTSQTAAQGLVTTTASGNRTTLVSIQQTLAPMTGNCGGTASGTLTIDDATSNTYATIIFDNYCDTGVTLSGSMNFSLILDTTSPDYGLMTMNFTNVHVIGALTSLVISGSIQYDSLVLNPATTINMLLQSSVGRVYKIQNLTMTEVTGTDVTGDYTDISMNGRLYDPDFGYVDMTTTLQMRVYTTDYWPSSGSYILTGNGNATVTLTASPSGYQLDLDLNGDGIVDGTPVTGIWLNINPL